MNGLISMYFAVDIYSAQRIKSNILEIIALKLTEPINYPQRMKPFHFGCELLQYLEAKMSSLHTYLT